MTKPVALITGITGQDGSYLCELLLSKGYVVHGIKRRSSYFNTTRIDDIYQDPHSDSVNLFLHYGDVTDSSNISAIIQETMPDEIYNLAAQSHVAISFNMPDYTDITVTDNSEQGWFGLKNWYLNHPDTKFEWDLQYPVEIIHNDTELISVNNFEEMIELKKNCN